MPKILFYIYNRVIGDDKNVTQMKKVETESESIS
jgi:hypothetical protein